MRKVLLSNRFTTNSSVISCDDIDTTKGLRLIDELSDLRLLSVNYAEHVRGQWIVLVVMSLCLAQRADVVDVVLVADLWDAQRHYQSCLLLTTNNVGCDMGDLHLLLPDQVIRLERAVSDHCGENLAVLA